MKMFIALLMATGLIGTASAATTGAALEKTATASQKKTGSVPFEGMFNDQVTSVAAVKIVCITFTEKVKQDQKIGTKETKECTVEKDANL